MTKPHCAIVVPVHNNAALTRQCLNTLLAQPAASVDCEIVVVDDASTDATPALLERYAGRIRRLRLERNAGFAMACNTGARGASGEYVVFLNNDTVPQPGWLDALVRYAASHPAAGIVGSKLLYPNDTVQHAGVVFNQNLYPIHIYRYFPHDHPAVTVSRRFQAVTGACLLVRRGVFDALGGFEQRYLNGYEDIDFCLRAGELGVEVHYCHESVLYHLESVSREGRPGEELRNRRLFAQRWGERLVADDLRYYQADGLLQVEYRTTHVRFTIAPEVGVVERDERERRVARLLDTRSQQVAKLLHDNVRLRSQLLNGQDDSDPPAPEPPRVPEHAADAVTVIVPIYNAYEDVVANLASLLAHTDFTRHRLVLVDDASTDPRVSDYLAQFAATLAVAPLILSNARNMGFVAAVNRGLAEAQGDVIVLNSDTVVTANWLEKLQAAAQSRPNVASVTPFSNNATLCSIPRINVNNPLPPGYTLETFAALIERISLRTYPELPTAHGFCMYLTATALAAVGRFDAERFERGYGEENDWCMRATDLGFVHLLDDATYIFHHGERSFGAQETAAIKARNGPVLDALHPQYQQRLELFFRRNSLRPLHEYIAAALRVDRRARGRLPVRRPTPARQG